MKRRLADYRVFFAEFRRTFRTTGAIMPSGRALARALAHHVSQNSHPQRILEVGPGTGAVTAHIVTAVRPQDRFELVELNDRFVDCLNERFANDPAFRAAAAQSRVIRGRIEDLADGEPYDTVISGLPLNNFAVAEVEQILDVLVGLVRPGGTLSFFEYIAVRNVKAALSGPAQRQRLRGISHALDRLFRSHDVRHRCILANVPPAWVHHVRVGASS
jgi:phospholipid N-methyltransferase